MSAWSDHKCGALTDEEYEFVRKRERGENDDKLPFEDDFDDEYEDEYDDYKW